MRLITSGREARGPTPISLQVSTSEAITAQCAAPPSEPANSAFFRVRAISWSFCPYRAGSRGPLSLASPLRASRLPPPQRAAYLRAVRADRSGARRRHGYGGVDARSRRVRGHGDRLPAGVRGRAPP